MLIVAYVCAHDLELLTLLLRSTEFTHAVAIRAGLDLTDHVMQWDEPYRSRMIDLIFQIVHGGDAFGSFLLRLFEAAVWHHLP